MTSENSMSRRGFLGLTGLATAGAFGVSIGAFSNPAAATTETPPTTTSLPHLPKREFRAMWIASVLNINWPRTAGSSITQQQNEFIEWMELAREINLNAVFSQVRPTADAFWPSRYEPWSQYLTGTQGKDPGYDPLAFQVEEAHKRNLEYHAWFNPYRVSMQADINKLSAEHPARKNPHWVFPFAGKLYYNPGIPEVRKFVQDAMLDAVTKYDLDGVHFDDYFYPYPSGTLQLPDQETFAQYGAGFSNIEDWRRNNVDLMVSEFGQAIKKVKPWVKFGISPFGIWQNKSITQPLGSETNGTQSYSALFADTRKWVKEEYLDYINPQIYWFIGQAAADYAKLVPWWADVVRGTDVHLYIGQGAYKATDGIFTDPNEMLKHVDIDRATAEVGGSVFYNADSVRNALGEGQWARRLVDTYYSHPALLPLMPHLGGTVLRQPTLTGSKLRSNGVTLEWHVPGNQEATSFAIWRFNGKDVSPKASDFADANYLIATERSTGRFNTFVDDQVASTDFTYVVTALDRLGNESAPSKPRPAN